MKIEKLYTLSQFVEYLYCEYDPEPGQFQTLEEHKSECFDLTVNYMQFLKQPLKKEMFVNEIEKPESLKGFYETHPEGMKEEAEARKAWQEAEKKVIF